MLLSVIVPTWNSLEHLIEMVDGWELAGREATRLVVVDDGSDDRSLEYMASRAERSDLLFMTQNNSGPGAARNLGLRAVETPYVCFADVDDIVEWKALSETIGLLASAPGVDVLTASVPGAGLVNGGYRLLPSSARSRIQYLSIRMAVWGRVYRTSFLRRLEPLFPNTRAAEDVLASVRVASAARAFAISPAIIYRRRQIGTSLTTRSDYADLAAGSMELVAREKVERYLKLYALGASAKYFAKQKKYAQSTRTIQLAISAIR